MKFSLRLGALFGLGLSLLAAGPLRAQTGTNISGTIMSGGITRNYFVYVPTSYHKGKPVPLVINSHGQGVPNSEEETETYFRQVADTANFLLVYPQALVDPSFSNQTAWNAFGSANRVDDVGFISDLLTKLEADYSIDAQRVYASGHSNGDFMSFLLASQLSTRIAAMGAASGGMIGRVLDACAPVRPVPVLELHGTADGTVPIGGSGGDWSPVAVADVMAKWAKINGCASTPAINTLPYTSPWNSTITQVRRSVWSTSAGAGAVVLEEIIGGDHRWDQLGNFSDNAATEIWHFLRQFRLPSPTTQSANLALNKPVCSSGLENSWLPSSGAVDGNPDTRWSSAFNDQQWLTVDLGASYNVNRVKLNWNYACGKDYNIQVSKDGLSWTNIKSVTGNTTTNLVTDYTGLAGTGRYVRMNGTARATQYGYSISEFEVYGTSAATPLPVRASTLADAPTLFPNPTRGAATLQGAAPGTAVEVVDALGRLILHTSTDAAGTATLALPAGLARGIYAVRTGQQVLRVVLD